MHLLQRLQACLLFEKGLIILTGYLVLFGLLFALFLITLNLSGWEIFAPAPLYSIGMLVSVALAVAGGNTWNLYELKAETLFVVAFGSLSFCLGACLIYGRLGLHTRSLAKRRCPVMTDGETTVRQIQLWKFIPLIAVVLIALVIRISETYEIAESLGVQGSYAECAAVVRKATSQTFAADAMRFGVGFSFVERQLEKLVTAIGYVGAFLLAKALACRSNNKWEVVPSGLLLVLVGCFALSKGGRGDIIMYVIAVVSIWYFLRLRDVADVKKFTLRVILACALLAVLLAATLYATGELVGRKAGSGFFEYITFYFGGSVPSLQLLLDQGAPSVDTGVRTFYGLSNLVYKFGFIDTLPSYSIAWVDTGGHESNIFTCFARYYLDYGYAGVGVLSLLSGALMSGVYGAARRFDAAWLIAVVGMFSPYIFDMAREEFVFSRLLSLHFPMTIALIVLLTLFATRPFLHDSKRWIAKLLHRSEVE